MFNVSEEFKKAIVKPSRDIDVYVMIDDIKLTTTEVQNFSIEYSLCTDGVITIGGITSNKLTLNLLRFGRTPTYYKNRKIRPFVGIKRLNVETSVYDYEYIPLGVFYVDNDNVKKTDKVVNIECFDRMVEFDTLSYFTDLSYPTALENVTAEVTAKTGIEFEAIPYGFTVQVKPSATTIRSLLSEIAIITSTNANINRYGKVQFTKFVERDFTLNSQNYINFSLGTDEKITVGRLKCHRLNNPEATDEENTFVIGSSNTNTAGIEFSTSLVLDYNHLNRIYSTVYPISYPNYLTKTQGMPHLDVGDIIDFNTDKGKEYLLPIVRHKLSYNGGLVSELSASGVDGEWVSISNGCSNTSIKKKVEEIKENIGTEVQDYIEQNDLIEGDDIINKINQDGSSLKIDGRKLDVDISGLEIPYDGDQIIDAINRNKPSFIDSTKTLYRGTILQAVLDSFKQTVTNPDYSTTDNKGRSIFRESTVLNSKVFSPYYKSDGYYTPSTPNYATAMHNGNIIFGYRELSKFFNTETNTYNEFNQLMPTMVITNYTTNNIIGNAISLTNKAKFLLFGSSSANTTYTDNLNPQVNRGLYCIKNINGEQLLGNFKDIVTHAFDGNIGVQGDIILDGVYRLFAGNGNTKSHLISLHGNNIDVGDANKTLVLKGQGLTAHVPLDINLVADDDSLLKGKNTVVRGSQSVVIQSTDTGGKVSILADNVKVGDINSEIQLWGNTYINSTSTSGNSRTLQQILGDIESRLTQAGL